MEAYRRLAVERVNGGLLPAQVASVLGVFVEIVRRWVRPHKEAGVVRDGDPNHKGQAVRNYLSNNKRWH